MTVCEPYYQDAIVTLYCGRAEAILPSLGHADLVVTDPPYNVGKDYGAASDDLPDKDYAALMQRIVQECRRIAPNQAWVAPRYKMALWLSLLQEAHLVVIRRGAAGPFRQGWSDQFETLLAVGKPSSPSSDIWENIRLKGEGYFSREETYGHPGYTPEGILRRCIALLSREGEIILDPFCGTGTALVAAKVLGRTAIGIEADERWCRIAVERLQQGVLALPMTARPPLPMEATMCG